MGEVEVTPAMIEAGRFAFDRFWAAGGPDEADVEGFLKDVFKAMFYAAEGK